MSERDGRRYPNEAMRWQVLFGLPMLVACIAMAMTIATSIHWLIALCLAFGPGVGVVSLVYLAISSDTNGDIEPPAVRIVPAPPQQLASGRMSVANAVNNPTSS
jgi:hypothetical protein